MTIEPNFILQGIFCWYSFNSYWIFPKCNYCAIWERLYLILLRNFPRPIYYFRKSCHQWLLSVVFELPILSTVPVHFITSCVARSKHLHNEIYIILLKIILFLPLRHHTDIFKTESNYESIQDNIQDIKLLLQNIIKRSNEFENHCCNTQYHHISSIIRNANYKTIFPAIFTYSKKKNKQECDFKT